MNAARDFLPPTFIVPGKSMQVCGLYMNNALKNFLFAATQTGWIDSKSLFSYVANLFNKQLEERRIPRPVLLLVDGHSTH